jgi:hypothetical protein
MIWVVVSRLGTQDSVYQSVQLLIMGAMAVFISISIIVYDWVDSDNTKGLIRRGAKYAPMSFLIAYSVLAGLQSPISAVYPLGGYFGGLGIQRLYSRYKKRLENIREQNNPES